MGVGRKKLRKASANPLRGHEGGQRRRGRETVARIQKGRMNMMRGNNAIEVLLIVAILSLRITLKLLQRQVMYT